MEVPRGNERKPLVAAYELFGSALFVYMILVSTGDAIAVPLALFSMIIIFGGITGGHFNPAVTLGVFVAECSSEKYKANLPTAVLVSLGQLIGALLGMCMAAFSLSAKIDGSWQVPDHRVPILAPQDPEDATGGVETGEDGFNENWQTLFTQIACTFIFVSVILMLKGTRTNPSNDGALQALTVALTLGGLIQVANHHAATFNPAVTLAMTVFQTTALDNDTGYLSHYYYAYFVGPLIGGFLAGLFARIHRPLHEDQPKSLPQSQDEERASLLRNGQPIAV